LSTVAPAVPETRLGAKFKMGHETLTTSLSETVQFTTVNLSIKFEVSFSTGYKCRYESRRKIRKWRGLC